MHRLWYSEGEKANSEQGGVSESEHGAHNVASLDGFVSLGLGKSSVTKEEF